MQPDYRKHEAIITDFLKELNKETDAFILKGGTALRQCYGLDRFSEDIDLDSSAKNIILFARKYCRQNGFELREAKNTDMVKRVFITYASDVKGLKVEVSYRRKHIFEEEIVRKNGITVYSIDRLASMKAAAYIARDKIRDLYDITFICNHYFDMLSDTTKNLLRDSFEQKGLENFDYLIQTGQDPLIDNGKLAEDFLVTLDKLEILYEERDKEREMGQAD